MRVARNVVVIFILLVVVGLSIIFTAVPGPVSASVTVYDTSINVYEHNGTGRAANDLEVCFNGKVLATDWYGGGIFKNFSLGYDSATNISTMRWYNGTVAPCEWVYTCMFFPNTLRGNITYTYLPTWSYDGVIGPIVGAALSQDVVEVKPGLLQVTFSNTPKDGGPETIGSLQIGVSNTIYNLPELAWTNEAINKIPWIVQKNNIPLKLGQQMSFSIPISSNTAGIIYRAKIWLDSDPKNVIGYIGQIVPKTTVTPQQ